MKGEHTSGAITMGQVEQDARIYKEIDRVVDKIDAIATVQAEQGKALAVLAESQKALADNQKALADKQKELQDSQKELATAIKILSETTTKVQHNCEMRRENYSTLTEDIYGEDGLIQKVKTLHTRVDFLSRALAWAGGLAGTAAMAFAAWVWKTWQAIAGLGK